MIILEECIFCNVENKEKMLYEDELCFAMPDKYPSEYGHALVISKEHYDNVLAAPDALVSHIFLVAKKLGSSMKKGLQADGIVIATNTGREAGQVIFHLHVHVIPKYQTRRIGFMPHRELDAKTAAELKSLLKLQ